MIAQRYLKKCKTKEKVVSKKDSCSMNFGLLCLLALPVINKIVIQSKHRVPWVPEAFHARLVVSFLTVRFRTGRKFSIQSFIIALSSFAIFCTAGRAMVETADKGMEVSGTGYNKTCHE